MASSSPFDKRALAATPSHRALFTVSAIAGQKRAAPCLLPAFEPASSSPKLPKISRILDASHSPSKRLNTLEKAEKSILTSTTVIPSSSSPSLPNTRRLGLTRTASALSERAPLATVPSIELDESGEPTLMGRSSNSSHYQLSTNKLISRVHVRAAYIPATNNTPNRVQIACKGWNGVKVHCQGKAWDLYKNDTFTSETENADIMIDVQDARVLVVWPKKPRKALTPSDSEGTWDSENSPSRTNMSPRLGRRTSHPYSTSPLRRQHRLQSPVSPTPVNDNSTISVSAAATSNLSMPPLVQIYEDEPVDEVLAHADQDSTQPTQSTQFLSQPLEKTLLAKIDYNSDNDEENDPIIHSFGPFGADISNRLESFTTNASPSNRSPLKLLNHESTSARHKLVPQSILAHVSSTALRPSELIGATDRKPSPVKGSIPDDLSPLESSNKNQSQIESTVDSESASVIAIAINHLLFSQLSATPLSALLQEVKPHLPQTQTLSSSSLHSLLKSKSCIGVVSREGKDAAGKPLESEYYYIPENDTDPGRREVVADLGIGGRGLRNCRKSHKQYFWRKPK